MPLFITTDDQDMLLTWAADRADLGPGVRWPSQAVAVAIRDADDFTVRGVLVTVEAYRGVIDIHFASDNARKWATRQSLTMLFEYLFHIRGAHRLQTVHHATHRKKSAMIMRLGFTVEARLRSALGPGEDGIMFAMTPNECEWLQRSQEGS